MNIGYPVSVSNLPVKYPFASGKLMTTPNKEVSFYTKYAEQPLSGESISILPFGPSFGLHSPPGITSLSRH